MSAYTTFQVVQPPRPASCAEYGCDRFRNGWVTVVPEGDKADLCRSLRGRYRFTEVPQPGGLVEFTFEPGQECWQQHLMPWDGRERLFQSNGRRGVAVDGVTAQFLSDPRTAREFTRGDDWVDAFAENQILVADLVERG